MVAPTLSSRLVLLINLVEKPSEFSFYSLPFIPDHSTMYSAMEKLLFAVYTSFFLDGLYNS